MIKVIFPEYISINDWGGALIADYANEPLPILVDEKDWKEWGAIVAGTGIFLEAGIPSPINVTGGKKQQNFKDWQEWAKAVYSIMANEKSIKSNVR